MPKQLHSFHPPPGRRLTFFFLHIVQLSIASKVTISAHAKRCATNTAFQSVFLKGLKGNWQTFIDHQQKNYKKVNLHKAKFTVQLQISYGVSLKETPITSHPRQYLTLSPFRKTTFGVRKFQMQEWRGAHFRLISLFATISCIHLYPMLVRWQTISNFRKFPLSHEQIDVL